MDKNLNPAYEKTCPVGNHSFTAKRTNQVYCSLEHQKFKNNSTAKIKRDLTKQVNAILTKNREILEKLYKTTKTIDQEQMKLYGYRYDYHTSVGKEENVLVYSIYDFTLIPIGNNTYKIKKESIQWKD